MGRRDTYFYGPNVLPVIKPKLKETQNTVADPSTNGDKAFSVAASRASKRLPMKLKLLRSTDAFRHQLKKTFLFLSA